MLKWTVNRRIDPIAPYTTVTRDADRLKRRSMGQPLNRIVAADQREPRRKSLATVEHTKRYRQRQINKENMHLASPHPMAVRQQASNAATSTPYAHQSSALRDVGNTTPQRLSLNALNTTPLRKRNLPPSPLLGRSPAVAAVAAQAATPPSVVPVAVEAPQTLPSGAAIALRGLTVPLHFRAAQPSAGGRSSADMSPLSRRLAELRFSKVSIQRHQIFSNHCDDEDDMMNLSSKALNDTALDQMIDEILYSTRKVRPLISRSCAPVPPAPQVTPNSTILQLQAPAPAATASESVVAMDVRSPEPEVCQLRRQGGVRRKRTHKTFESGATAEQTRKIDALMASHPYLRQSIEILASLETPPKKMRWV